MISTKYIAVSLKDVPEVFIFESFLKLNTKLIGQEEVIKSVFTDERTPSMTIFFDQTKKRYYYKCFSSGFGGTAFELVQRLFPGHTRSDIAVMILDKYKDYLKGNPIDTNREYRQFGKYKVDGFHMRNWSDVDKKFWTPGNISSKILERFNVAALQSFTMSKMEEDVKKTINISRDKIYGYFRKTGDIARIYQPNTGAKYIKVLPYIQGSDQLKYESGTLLILSGLKDAMSFASLDISGIEVVCPDSENVLINQEIIETYRTKYNRILTCFDNDSPGINAMEKYKDKYKIKGIYLKMEDKKGNPLKDVFDCCVAWGPEVLRKKFISLLDSSK